MIMMMIILLKNNLKREMSCYDKKLQEAEDANRSYEFARARYDQNKSEKNRNLLEFAARYAEWKEAELHPFKYSESMRKVIFEGLQLARNKI
jgi:hypothetical protein